MTLQRPNAPDDLLLITSFQWHELWFKVLLADLRGVIADRGATYESIKLLRRGIALFRLFDLQLGFGESVIVRELKLTQALRDGASEQLAQLATLTRRLPALARQNSFDLAQIVSEYLAQFKTFRARFRDLSRNTLTKKSRAPTYAEWLCLAELLDLQPGVKADWASAGEQPTTYAQPKPINADENMFIIVHQCFELWFKVLLDHIDRAIPLITENKIVAATRLLRRVVEIMRVLVQQIQIPATMLPLDFARFRSERKERDGKVFVRGLSPASGTESYQFREIEIVAGLRDDSVFRNYLSGTEKLPIRLLTPHQEERLHQPTLPDAFRSALQARGIAKLDTLFTPANQLNPNLDLANLADTLIDFDEAFRAWRLAHVSMVEKMIGAKSGTGFLGPEYLLETAGIRIQEKNRVLEERQVRPRFFEELWQVRTRLGAY